MKFSDDFDAVCLDNNYVIHTIDDYYYACVLHAILGCRL